MCVAMYKSPTLFHFVDCCGLELSNAVTVMGTARLEPWCWVGTGSGKQVCCIINKRSLGPSLVATPPVILGKVCGVGIDRGIREAW